METPWQRRHLLRSVTPIIVLGSGCAAPTGEEQRDTKALPGVTLVVENKTSTDHELFVNIDGGTCCGSIPNVLKDVRLDTGETRTYTDLITYPRNGKPAAAQVLVRVDHEYGAEDTSETAFPVWDGLRRFGIDIRPSSDDEYGITWKYDQRDE